MNNSFSAIDLFCGAGGLHIGFEEAGFDIKLCVDNNNLVEKTHRRNFPNIPMINRNISQITIEEIEDYCGDGIDIIIGGPPCQGFSTIGKRVSSDPDKRSQKDPRNELVISYAKIIRALKPKFIVMENVKGILTMSGGIYIQTVLSEWSGIGTFC